jgi:hypothetical protein
MRINQEITVKKIQETPEEIGTEQNVNSNHVTEQKDSWEYAKSTMNPDLLPSQDLGSIMQEDIRNKRQMESAAFKEYDEKANRTMNNLSELIGILGQLRRGHF